MRFVRYLTAASLAAACMGAAQGAPASLLLKTAGGHPMQYYVALPAHWTPDRQWPIVVVAEAADKEFKLNAERFAEARGELPFIIVAPINVTNGSQGQGDPKVFPYSRATWDAIAKDGVCKFDLDGLEQVIREVKRDYRGEDKVYLTGFEAGTHLVWAEVFRHPEWLAAAAPVAGNYRGRCMEDGAFSAHPARAALPLRALSGGEDTLWGQGGGNYAQWLDAKKLAQDHGYANFSETIVAGKGHVPLPREVLDWFFSVWSAARR